MKYLHILSSKLLEYLPSRLYLYAFHYRATGEVLQLRNPQRFTHKIEWLKAHGKVERFAPYADKYTVRSYVEATVGASYLVPLLGVWDNANDIAFDTLPDRFVLKVTKGCGYNFICKDKSTIDIAATRRLLNSWLHKDFYKLERELQYKPGKARIIAEAYLEDKTGSLRDYKFFCSKGEPKVIRVDSDRFTGHKSDLLDVHWKKLSYVSLASFGEHDRLPEKPETLPTMLMMARKLSKNFPFVRVDLYSVDNKVYFGELTFTPGSGVMNLRPVSGDVELGKLVDLSAY